MPLYAFCAIQPSGEVQLAWSETSIRKLAVFTSTRAVRFGLGHIPRGELGEIEFAAIGDATRARLEALGHEVQVRAASGYTSEDLLQASTLASNPGLAVIFCAPGGRDALASGLQQLGWKVIEAMVYERVALKPSATHIEAIDGANELVSVWTSISALELAREQLPGPVWDKVLDAPALVISQRIQHHLQRLGASRVEMADGPGNVDLLRSIMRLLERLDSA
jgi:uroporphyrinogen-III synthase